jgi:dihydroneopterin aldolase
MARGGPTVVKLGGSHAFAAHLRAWVDALARCAGRLVVVPGGGPFADGVRAAQPKMGFDDRAAHHMAMLAMEQYGCALASLDRRLAPAVSLTAIRAALADGRVPVWLPTRMALAARDIPRSWDVTSDSLAAWLAGRLDARRLILVKQVVIEREAIHARELVARGIADKSFAHFLKASGAAGFIARPDDHVAIASAVDGAATIGTRIE